MIGTTPTSGVCAACSAASLAASAFAQACANPEPSAAHRTRFCDDHRFDANGNPREGDENYQISSLFDDPNPPAFTASQEPSTLPVKVSEEAAPLNSVTVVTWNILGDQYDRDQRLVHAAQELEGVDVVAIQEAIIPQDGTQDTASALAALADMRVASFIPVGATNGVSGDRMHTAILTRLEVVKANIAIKAPNQATFHPTGEPTAYAAALLKTKTGRLLLIISFHLPWGAENEIYRLQHLQAANLQVSQLLADLPKGTIAILAGDFNTLPHSDSMRYLRGESAVPQNSTFYVDPWDVLGVGPGYTNDPTSGNTNLLRTAISVGIPAPQMLPSRRIDYLLVKGWAYGSPGAPLSVELVGTRPGALGVHASDHFGVKAKLWDPEIS